MHLLFQPTVSTAKEKCWLQFSTSSPHVPFQHCKGQQQDGHFQLSPSIMSPCSVVSSATGSYCVQMPLAVVVLISAIKSSSTIPWNLHVLIVTHEVPGAGVLLLSGFNTTSSVIRWLLMCFLTLNSSPTAMLLLYEWVAYLPIPCTI